MLKRDLVLPKLLNLLLKLLIVVGFVELNQLLLKPLIFVGVEFVVEEVDC